MSVVLCSLYNQSVIELVSAVQLAARGESVKVHLYGITLTQICGTVPLVDSMITVCDRDTS